jgi:uncharacterized membrane protein YgaE (UPF0421/DUF939 family)
MNDLYLLIVFFICIFIVQLLYIYLINTDYIRKKYERKIKNIRESFTNNTNTNTNTNNSNNSNNSNDNTKEQEEAEEQIIDGVDNNKFILKKQQMLFKPYNDIEYDNYANPEIFDKIIQDTYSNKIIKRDYSKGYDNFINNKVYCQRPELDICLFKNTKTKY